MRVDLLAGREHLLVDATCEVYACANNDDAPLSHVVEAGEPVADAVGEVGLESSLILQVAHLRADVDLVGDQGNQGCQGENVAEQDDVAELLHQVLIHE